MLDDDSTVTAAKNQIIPTSPPFYITNVTGITPIPANLELIPAALMQQTSSNNADK